MDFETNFIRFPAVQKVRKSVKISQLTQSVKVGTFLRHTVYTYMK